MSANAYLYIGDDDRELQTYYSSCNCSITTMRFYRDHFVNDPALMDIYSQLGIGNDQVIMKFFNFNCFGKIDQVFKILLIPQVPPSSSFTVLQSSWNSPTEISSQGSLDSTNSDLNSNYGAYFLKCDGTQELTYDFQQNLLDSITIVFWIHVMPNIQNDQPIFTLRSAGDTSWRFKMEVVAINEALSIFRLSQFSTNYVDLEIPESKKSTLCLLKLNYQKIDDGWVRIVINHYFSQGDNVNSKMVVFVHQNEHTFTNISIPTLVSPKLTICEKLGTSGTPSTQIELADFTILSGVGGYFPNTDQWSILIHYLSDINYFHRNFFSSRMREMVRL